jgi:hypothetical protein
MVCLHLYAVNDYLYFQNLTCRALKKLLPVWKHAVNCWNVDGITVLRDAILDRVEL